MPRPVVFALLGWFWVAGALILTAVCYLRELAWQRDPAALQTPLARVGARTLLQSIVYTLMVIAGLWRAPIT